MPTLHDLPKIAATLKEKRKPTFVILEYASFKKFVASIPLTGEIDEADYLRRYADVARAVAEGKVASATRHYKIAGYAEQRAAKLSKAGPAVFE